jgi:NADH dehydrogenase FAD-containing subunit
VRSIDLTAKRVHCTRGLRPVRLDLDYDHLVLALGSETNFFSIPGVAENAVTLKTLGFIAWFLWRGVYLLKLPRLAKKARVALSWLLEMIFSKDLEQMLTLRDVELISRIATSLRTDGAK